MTDHRYLGGPGRFRDSGMMDLPTNAAPRAFWQADLTEATRAFEENEGKIAGMTTYMNIDARYRRVEIGHLVERADLGLVGEQDVDAAVVEEPQQIVTVTIDD